MKKTKAIDFEVVVEVHDSWMYRNDLEKRTKYLRGEAERIVKDIRRHVDDIGRVEFRAITEEVCEHCGGHWTEDSAAYNGGCCEKDEANNPKPEAA